MLKAVQHPGLTGWAWRKSATNWSFATPVTRIQQALDQPGVLPGGAVSGRAWHGELARAAVAGGFVLTWTGAPRCQPRVLTWPP
jgi:hypothetical protein